MSRAKKRTVPKLNKTPGGSFTRDPESGELIRVESTKRDIVEPTAADKSAAKTKEK